MSDALPPRPIADRLDADEAPQDWPRPAVGLAHPDRLAVVEAVIALPLWEPATQRALDRVARLALRSFDAWQALVTLVESDELLVVSARGEGTFHSGERCPLPTTLCHLVVQRGEPLVVRDAREDPRFRSFREVTEQGVVAYAGVPLVVRGAVVGTVVIVDRVPRDWPAGAADVLRDLADSAVTELELRATLSSERSFASLAEHLPDCLSRVDRDRRYAYANDAFARALDVPAARIVGTRIGTFPRDAARHPACRALIERAFDEGAPITTTLELPVDGVTRWFELRLIPERDVDEEIESVLWILRDVTADVLSARRLRDREEQLRAIFQQAIVGVCMLQSGRIVYGNPRLAEMLGYESADALTELDVVERL
ncbi:MAG TPA: PAS domain-containing protein, partial [Gemmatimonadaceae bacterium]|nr:PAS domain-containing protein [Gemmatimonadaceae bacterium]